MRLFTIDFNSTELKKLHSIELKSWQYMRKLKTWNTNSKVIVKLRAQWEAEAQALQILDNDRACVLYNDKKHSYTFGDSLA